MATHHFAQNTFCQVIHQQLLPAHLGTNSIQLCQIHWVYQKQRSHRASHLWQGKVQHGIVKHECSSSKKISL